VFLAYRVSNTVPISFSSNEFVNANCKFILLLLLLFFRMIESGVVSAVQQIKSLVTSNITTLLQQQTFSGAKILTTKLNA